MTAPTTFVSGAILTAAQMNALPWGIVDATAGGTSGRGWVNSGTNFTMTTTVADVTSMTVTWTAVAGRLYRASFSAMPDNVGTAQYCFVYLTNAANTIQAERQVPIAASLPNSISLERVFTGLTGSQTLKIRAGVSAASNAILSGSARFGFSIEDIGPST
jgi:hypothetical protein